LSEDDAVAFFYSMHHGGGVLWQSPWNLTFDGPLQQELSRSGFRHPDDMSEAVLRSFWRRLHKRPIELAGTRRQPIQCASTLAITIGSTTGSLLAEGRSSTSMDFSARLWIQQESEIATAISGARI
jgi:hypothetical protein